MIGVVIGHQQCFAQERLSLSVRDARVQVRGGVRDELLHGFKVSFKRCYTLVPCPRIRGSCCRGPVAAWPVWRHVTGITAKLEDIPLRDTQVLDNLPSRMGRIRRLHAAKFLRKTGHSFFEIDMGASTL